MFKEKIKKLIPHVVAVVIFIVLSSVYFYPQVEGYRLRQGDIEQHIGASKEIADYRALYKSEPLWTNSMFSGMPAYQISTLSSNLMPVIENIVLTPLSRPIGYIVLAMIGFYILLLCFGINPWLSIIGAVAFGFSSVNMLYLEGGHNSKVLAIALLPTVIGSLILAYRKNLIIGALLFAFFMSLEFSANHLQMTYYGMFLVALIVLVELYIHFKDKLYLKFIKASSVLLVAGIVGILPSFSNLYTTYEYGKYSTRGKSELTISPNQAAGEKQTTGNALDPDYITQYNMGYGEVWSVIIPNVKGGAANYIGNDKDAISKVNPQYREYVAQSPSYWGEQLFSGGAFYFGVSMFVLFILGLVFIKDPIKWAFVAASALAVVLSWKYGGIIDAFIQHFPLFKKFRDTKMILVLMQIAFPVLGLLFVKEMFTTVIERKKLLYTLLIINGILFLFYILPGTFFDFISFDEAHKFEQQTNSIQNNPDYLNQFQTYISELEGARMAIFKKDVLRSLFFSLVVSGLVYIFVLGKLKKNTFLAILGIVVLVDLWAVDKRYLNNEQTGSSYNLWEDKTKYDNPHRATTADNFILSQELKKLPALQSKISSELTKQVSDIEKEKVAFRDLNFATDYRVLTLQDPFNNTSVSYFHKSIGGYHGAKLKKYQELIDFYIGNEYEAIVKTLQDSTTTQAKIDSVLKNATPVLDMLNTKYIIYNPNAAPLVNQYAFGSAWFVKNVRIVDNANDEILSLGKVDLRNTAVVNRKYQSLVQSMGSDSLASISLESYLPNRLIYKFSSKTPQVAVFSEIYYPKGWDVFVDGKKQDYFSADYILRAMSVPAGNHTIEFKFEPKSYSVGNTISLSSSVLLLLLLVGALVWEIYKGVKKEEVDK